MAAKDDGTLQVNKSTITNAKTIAYRLTGVKGRRVTVKVVFDAAIELAAKHPEEFSQLVDRLLNAPKN